MSEQILDVVIQHARDAMTEAWEDDGLVLIKADMLSVLLQGIADLQREVAAGEQEIALFKAANPTAQPEP